LDKPEKLLNSSILNEENGIDLEDEMAEKFELRTAKGDVSNG
jgi:hypothetical protein